MLQRAVAANVRSLRGICERILRTKRHRHTRLPSPYCSGHTSLSPRDICLSTFIKKRNTLYLRIKNYKSGHSPPGEKIVNLGGPGGIRTLDLFSAMGKNAGNKAKIAVFYVYYRPKSTVCFSILVPNCTRVVPAARKNERRSAALSMWGFDTNDDHEKKHRLHFSLWFH